MYRLTRKAIRTSTDLFFDQVNVRGEPEEEGPLVIIAPHPYSVMDPMLVAFRYDRPVDIIAKATLFGPDDEQRKKMPFLKRKAAELYADKLKRMRMHPIHRAQDGATFSQMKENLRKLDELSDIIAAGGAVLIFVEGQSNRTRREIDTVMDGGARLALDALAKLNPEKWNDVKVQVVGIDYGDFADPYNSTVTLSYEKAYSVKEFGYAEGAKRKERDERYEALAAKMHKDLEASIAKVTGPHAELVELAQKFYSAEVHDDHVRIAETARIVNAINPEGENVEALKGDLRSYLSMRSDLHVRAGEERSPVRGKLLRLLLWLPAWIGFLLHYVPYRRVRRKVSLANTPPQGLGFQKFVCAVKEFSLWYAFLAVAFAIALSFSGMHWLPAIGCYFASLASYALLGVIAAHWLRRVNLLAWAVLLRPKFLRYKRLSRKIAEVLEPQRARASAMVTA